MTKRLRTLRRTVCATSAVLLTAAGPWHAAAQQAPTIAASGVIQPSAILHFADGGMETNFQIPGAVVRFPVPPPGFDPVVASDAELLRYAFPVRPTDPSGRAAWNARAAHMQILPTWAIAAHDGTFGTTNGKASANWSGWEDNAPTGATGPYFKQAVGSVTIPTISDSGSACGQNTAAIWVGLGGDPSNQFLIQAGSTWDSTDSTNQYATWWEFEPSTNPGQHFTSNPPFKIPAGHTAQYSVTDLETLPVPVTNGFDWSTWDTTTNQGKNGEEDFTNSFTRPDLTAEWIVERTQVTSTKLYTSLADFGAANWTYTDQVSPNGHGNVGATNPKAITMSNLTKNPAPTLASPTVLGNGGLTFSDQYFNCN